MHFIFLFSALTANVNIKVLFLLCIRPLSSQEHDVLIFACAWICVFTSFFDAHVCDGSRAWVLKKGNICVCAHSFKLKRKSDLARSYFKFTEDYFPYFVLGFIIIQHWEPRITLDGFGFFFILMMHRWILIFFSSVFFNMPWHSRASLITQDPDLSPEDQIVESAKCCFDRIFRNWAKQVMAMRDMSLLTPEMSCLKDWPFQWFHRY